MQNFVCFAKNWQQEAISRANNYFLHLPKFSLLHCKCHQTSKMPSRKFGSIQLFVSQQNPLFFDSYINVSFVWSSYFINMTSHFWLREIFHISQCEQGYKNKEIGNYKMVDVFCKHQTLYFVVGPNFNNFNE